MQPPQAFGVNTQVGLAERGQRRVEEPLFGLDQFGPDLYIDSDLLIVPRAVMQKPSQGRALLVIWRTKAGGRNARADT
jgi:hypothetical protein